MPKPKIGIILEEADSHLRIRLNTPYEFAVTEKNGKITRYNFQNISIPRREIQLYIKGDEVHFPRVFLRRYVRKQLIIKRQKERELKELSDSIED